MSCIKYSSTEGEGQTACTKCGKMKYSATTNWYDNTIAYIISGDILKSTENIPVWRWHVVAYLRSWRIWAIQVTLLLLLLLLLLYSFIKKSTTLAALCIGSGVFGAAPKVIIIFGNWMEWYIAVSTIVEWSKEHQQQREKVYVVQWASRYCVTYVTKKRARR